MAELMIAADLAVGGAGVSALERCCLGLPSLVLVLADNQRANAEALQRAGAARPASLDDRGDIDPLPKQLIELCREPATLAGMSRAAFAVTDGRGAELAAASVDPFR